MLTSRNPDRAAALFIDAIHVAEADMQEYLVMDIYREATQALVRLGRYADAGYVLMKFAVACDATKQTNAQNKAYLSTVVVYLAGGDVDSAWRAYQDSMPITTFATSDEAHAADALFTSYATGEAGKVKSTVLAHRPFQYIGERRNVLGASAFASRDRNDWCVSQVVLS